MENIQCKKCKIDKELNTNNFYWRKDSKKWNFTCKICISISSAKRYKQKSEIIKNNAAAYRNLNRQNINNKAIIYNNKKEVKNRLTRWRQENKTSLRKKEKEWQLKNPDKYKEIVRKKSKIQRQKTSYKIKAHVSRQINFALHSVGGSKNGNSVLKYLPYTIEELKQHLESLFEPWMTWNNWGRFSKLWNDNDQSTWKWNIDHIIPQSNFKYSSMEDENFKKCWALNNLRPLSAKQNVFDGSNRIRHV